MKSDFIIVLVSFIILCSFNQMNSEVIELYDSNFDELVLKAEGLWIIEIYSPTCSHCKNLEEDWKILSESLRGSGRVGKIDGTKNYELYNRLPFKAYPTILIFPPVGKTDKNYLTYTGMDRTAATLVSFCLKVLESHSYFPKIPQLLNEKQFSTYCKEYNDTCIIAFLSNIYDSSADERNHYLDIFKKAAMVGRGKKMSFFWVQGGDNIELEEKFGLTYGFPIVLTVNMQKKKYNVMKDSYSFDNIKSYINRLLIGNENFKNIPNNLPSIKSVEEWNGEDFKEIVEKDLLENNDIKKIQTEDLDKTDL